MEAVNLDEVKARREATAARLMKEVQEIIEIVVRDVPAFVKREARKLFVEALDFAESLDDEALKALKRRLAEEAAVIAKRAASKLADEQLWLGPDVPAGSGKSLEAHSAVWPVLQSIAEETRTLLLAAGFPPPDGGLLIEYRTPSWFIDGKYPPGMIEKYWAQLALLREIEAEIQAHDSARRRELVAKRWDGA